MLRHPVACVVAIAAVLTWYAIDGILVTRAFIWENRGLEFYQQRPHLLVLCGGIAIAVGLLVKLAAEHKRRRK